jgi:anti-anti-sigma factor
MLVYRDDKKKIVHLTPDRDLVSEESEAMCRELADCLCQGVESLVLDLARVRIIDGMSFETIIDVCSRMRKSRGKLVIENASRELKESFRMLRMSGRLTISSTGWPI